jgi:hypothetical protein
MIDPERYFPPGPASDCELARVSRGPALSAVVREELTGACVLYRPLRFGREPCAAMTPEGGRAEHPCSPKQGQEVRLGSGVFPVRQMCRPDQED